MNVHLKSEECCISLRRYSGKCCWFCSDSFISLPLSLWYSYN